jgi:hypothetical protein
MRVTLFGPTNEEMERIRALTLPRGDTQWPL